MSSDDGDLSYTSNDSFVRALLHEDPIGRIIRGHLYIEHALHEYARSRFIDPENTFDRARLNFPGTTYLAAGLGMPARLVSALLAVNSLRNDLAHRLHFEIDLDAWNKLWGAISLTDRKIITRAAKTAKGGPGEFKSLSLDDRTVLVFAGIRQSLRACMRLASGEWPRPGYYWFNMGDFDGVALITFNKAGYKKGGKWEDALEVLIMGETEAMDFARFASNWTLRSRIENPGRPVVFSWDK